MRITELTTFEAVGVALFTMCLVFMVLLALCVILKLISVVVQKIESLKATDASSNSTR